ncbi:MAG: MFS transporter [Nocardioidaceae bacterium]
MSTVDPGRTSDFRPGEGTDGANRPALTVMLLASTLTVMAGTVLAPVVELLRDDLDLTRTAAGLVLTAHGLSLAITGPFVGWTIDRWGVRWTLAAGLATYGVAGGAGLVLTSYPMLVASRVVFGVGAAAVFVGTTVALLDLAGPAAKQRVMGWRTTAISLGGVGWPLVGGALGALSWHASFGAYLVGLPLGVAVLRVLPSRGLPRPGAGRGGQHLGVLVRPRSRLLVVYFLQLVATVLLYCVVVFLPARLAELGITHSLLVAVFTVVLSVTMSIVGLTYAQVLRRLGYRALLAAAFGLWLAAFLCLGLGPTPVWMIVGPALFGVGMGLAVPALTVLAVDRAPVDLRAQATALLATTTFAAQFAAPLAFGPLAGATSVAGAYLCAAGLAGAAGLVVLTDRSWASRR